MKRVNISSGAVWEDLVGYSRAVRIGNQIEISGTTSVDGETVIGKGDLYRQTIYIFQKIEKTLIEAGASINDIVRTRMYVTDISKWEEAGRAHSEFLKDIKPATSMIEVKRLIDPDLLIEIEVTALIQK
ncbi:RidA family protein [Daejeonella sp.]|jgi:enamine deaminase RidA (YjgF/YER057c/UK114 family)|uniref:RidA family protein n=1 Tax=Daejeonella sp. TaxID=2805397 RepID=UPI00378308FF